MDKVKRYSQHGNLSELLMNDDDVLKTLSGRRPLDWLNIQQEEQIDFAFLDSLRKLGNSFMSLFSLESKPNKEEDKKVNDKKKDEVKRKKEQEKAKKQEEEKKK